MSYSIGFDIFAKDRASATFDKLGKKVGETGGKFSKSTAAFVAGGAVAATALVAFGKTSIDTFSSVGGESLKLQRYMGGTIEDASRLRYAGTQTGVGVDVLTTSMGKLSKGLVASGATAKTSAAMTKLLGFSARDAHGQMLPMSTLLPKLADKFKAMPPGTEKTALALKLFGKQGMAMIPMLNKGSSGLKELSAESDKFGNTLNTKDTAAVKDNVKQKRQMAAAIEGLQIMLGRILIPVVVKVSTKLAELARWFNQNVKVMGPLLTIVGGFIGLVVTITKAMKAWAAIQAILDAELFANPIGLVVVAIAALVGIVVLIATKTTWFQTIWKAMTNAIGVAWRWLWNNVLRPVIQFILNGFASVARAIGQVLSALGNVPGFGWAKTAGDFMLRAAGKASDLANSLHDIKSPAPIAIRYQISVTGAAPVLPGSHMSMNNRMRAAGGPVTAGMPYIVGEHRPEVFVPDTNGRILPRVGTVGSGGSGSGASDRPIIVQMVVDGRVLHQSLLKLQRTTGAASMGLA